MPKNTTLARLPVAALAIATPALAHPGLHHQMSWLERMQHFAEPDHLAVVVLIALAGWLAYRHGRRAEARARVKVERAKREQP